MSWTELSSMEPFENRIALSSKKPQRGAPWPVTIGICDESPEGAAQPRMTRHQEYRFLRFFRLAQREQKNPVRLPVFGLD